MYWKIAALLTTLREKVWVEFVFGRLGVMIAQASRLAQVARDDLIG